MMFVSETNITSNVSEFTCFDVNCRAVFGSARKRMFPGVNRFYVNECCKNEIIVGELKITRADGRSVILLPTKTKWDVAAKICDVETCFRNLNKFSETLPKDTRISIAKIACGKDDRLDFQKEILPLMQSTLTNSKATFYVHV
jgi:hypothetical protein